MSVTLLVGALFGDEGKGRVARELARHHDIAVRANGGPNASHTVFERGQKWVLRQVPCGVFSDAVCVLGDGMLIDIIDLADELRALDAAGVDVSRVVVSHRAHVILPSHKMRDRRREEDLEAQSIGTTRQGVGPAMVDKVMRAGLRVEDLLDDGVRRTVKTAERAAARADGARGRGLRRETSAWGDRERQLERVLDETIDALSNRVRDVGAFLRHAAQRDDAILVEGAQATLLDLDHGCWPHVTASSPTAAGLLVGTGLPPSAVTRTIGVTRAYTTRQAKGFLGTEVPLDEEDAFRARVKDWAIRVGHLDLPALRFAAAINGFTDVVVTKLDVFADGAPVRVCRAYDVDGFETGILPGTREALAAATPRFVDLEGWGALTRARTIEGLPKGARAFLDTIGEATGARVLACSTAREGPLVFGRAGFGAAPKRAPSRYKKKPRAASAPASKATKRRVARSSTTKKEPRR